jgi:hypothetical protein
MINVQISKCANLQMAVNKKPTCEQMGLVI